MRVIFRGRCTIWWKQAAKTVKIESSKHCLSLSLPQSAKLRKPQSTLSLSLSKCKSVKTLKVLSLSLSISLSLSLKVQNCGNLKVPSLSLRVQKCENPQSVVSLSLSQSAKLWKPQSSLSLSNMKYEVNMWIWNVNMKWNMSIWHVNLSAYVND